MGNEAPSTLSRYGVVLKGGRAGTLHSYLDNLQVRRADGSVVPVWSSAKDTRYQKPEPQHRFTNISVRVVEADKAK